MFLAQLEGKNIIQVNSSVEKKVGNAGLKLPAATLLNACHFQIVKCRKLCTFFAVTIVLGKDRCPGMCVLKKLTNTVKQELP